MKLLIIHNFYTHLTGEDLTVEEISEILKNSGKIKVIEYYKYSRDFQRLSWVEKLITLIKGNIPFYVHKDLKVILNKEKPDIAQIHNLIPLINIWVLKELKRRNIPVICSIHNYRIFCPRGTCFLKDKFCIRCFNNSLTFCIFYNCLENFLYSLLYVYKVFLQRLFLRYIDLFVSPSNFIKEFYTTHLYKGNIVILKKYIDVPEELKNLKVEKKGFVIFAGRLIKEKGILIVLESASLLKDIEFKICGEGPLLEYSQNLAKGRNLKNVKFLGLVEKYRLLKFIKEAYVLIFSSSWYEVSPRVLIESLSLGTPSVAPNIGVVFEILKDGYNGLLYEVNNSGDLAEKVRLLFEDKELYNRISCNAKSINLENTLGNYLQRLLNMYDNFLNPKAHV